MGFGAAWREYCDGEADHEGVWACGAGTVWDLFSLSYLACFYDLARTAQN